MFGVVVTKTETETAELTKADQAFLEGVAVRAGAGGFVFPLRAALVAGAALLLAAGVVLLAAGAIPLPSANVLTVYLPVADQSTNVLLVAGTGFVVGILSGMTGVGGGFLMTPLLMTIGIPSAVAAGTDSAQISGTASSGALAHSRLGNVDVKLGLTILAGSLVGGTVGVRLVHFLREMGNYDFCVRIIYIVVLGSVGTLMLREAVRTWARSVRTRMISGLVHEGFEDLKVKLAAPEQPGQGGLSRFAARWPLQTEFKKAGIRASLLFPLGMGLLIGLLAAIMGVGGGFIMVPSMIYILGVPTHVAVGTDLFQMVFTSSNVAFQQAITNHTVDILLAVLLLAGAAVGAQIGARLSTRLEGHQLRTFLGVVVVIVMVKMLFEIIMAPSSLFGLSGGGGGH
jgi:uncharacterized membrane protein YfcA